MVPTCLVMAGGRGERFGNPCKFMEEVCGEGILPRLLKQLKEVCLWVVVALSPHTLSCAREVCSEVHCLALPGSGYVEDLSLAIPMVRKPTLVVAADLVVGGQTLREFVNRSSEVVGRGVSVVTAVTSREGGEELIGLALFFDDGGPWENISLTGDARDVDTRKDLEATRRACSSAS